MRGHVRTAIATWGGGVMTGSRAAPSTLARRAMTPASDSAIWRVMDGDLCMPPMLCIIANSVGSASGPAPKPQAAALSSSSLMSSCTLACEQLKTVPFAAVHRRILSYKDLETHCFKTELGS